MLGESTKTGERGIALRRMRAADLPSVHRLLAESSLTTAGLDEWWPEFMVAEAAGSIVGIAGQERYADGVFLRSVAVHPSCRGTGLGRQLVAAVLSRAEADGHRDAYLLTTTAEAYFPRLGFRVIARAEVPASVCQSIEFRGACPSSAVVMHCRLSGSENALSPSTGILP